MHLQAIFYVCIESSLEWLYSWTQLNEKCSDPMNGPVLEINTSNRLNIFNKLLELLFCQMKGASTVHKKLKSLYTIVLNLSCYIDLKLKT